MRETLEKIKKEALDALSDPSAQIEELRIRYLGKKGELTAVLRGMGKLSAEERPVIGQLANEIRAEIEETVKACRKYGCPCDITLKDISTVGYRPENLFEWAQAASEVLDEYYGEA